jgi:hypothetical protein
MSLKQIENFHGKYCSLWLFFVYENFHEQIAIKTNIF